MVNFSRLYVSNVLLNQEKIYLYKAMRTLIVALGLSDHGVNLTLFLTNNLSKTFLMHKLMKLFAFEN